MEFDLPAETVVVTTKDVTLKGEAIINVSHEVDEEEGGEIWQFHADNSDFSEGNLQLVRLDTILKLDSTVAEVADLPVGYSARRQVVGETWVKFKVEAG